MEQFLGGFDLAVGHLSLAAAFAAELASDFSEGTPNRIRKKAAALT